MKVGVGYIISLIVFCVFSFSVLGLGKEATPQIMPWLSFAIFWVLFFTVYNDMRTIAHKEKRPQYNINPSPYKGLLYGLIGILPILAIQAIVISIKVPEDFVDFRIRVFQLISGPLYWIAKVFGNKIWMYMAANLSIIIMAFLGYLAGHNEFFIWLWIKNTLGKKRVKKG